MIATGDSPARWSALLVLGYRLCDHTGVIKGSYSLADFLVYEQDH